MNVDPNVAKYRAVTLAGRVFLLPPCVGARVPLRGACCEVPRSRGRERFAARSSAIAGLAGDIGSTSSLPGLGPHFH